MCDFCRLRMRLFLPLCGVVCVLLTTILAVDARGAQPVIFYPFGTKMGDVILPKNDDESFGVNISTSFPLFDANHDILFVNTNGVISFLVAVPRNVPDAFPVGDNEMLVAPFWADVNTLNGGNIFYRETTDADILTRASADVRQAFVSKVNFRASWVFIATWDTVSFCGGKFMRPKDSFQAVLITDGRHSFAIYNYGDIDWTTGQFSGGNSNGLGGIPAQAGFNAGDGVVYFSVPGSLTAAIVDIETTTNVDVPGRWMFRIDNANIEEGGSNTAGFLSIGPVYGSFLGGYETILSGPSLKMTDSVTCRFDTVETVGIVLDASRVACVVPIVLGIGRIPVDLAVNGKYNHSGIFTLTERFYAINKTEVDTWQAGDSPLSLMWDRNLVKDSLVDIDLVAFRQNGSQMLTRVIPIAASVSNNGFSEIPSRLLQTGPVYWAEVGALRIRSSQSDSALDVMCVWSDIHVLEWYMNLCLYEYTIARSSGGAPAVVDFFDDVWNSGGDILDEIAEDMENRPPGIHKRDSFDYASNFFENKCAEWAAEEAANPAPIDTIPCPCTTTQMEQDNDFQEGIALVASIFHTGAATCSRSIEPSPSGAGQQCCYGAEGDILPFSSGGGTHDRAHSDAILSHVSEDVWPYFKCCILSTANCQKYSDARPTDDCTNYVPPRPARGSGDPHLITLDGQRYTFNGKGEFTLINIIDVFELQGRAGQIENAQGTLTQATVWTAFAMKSSEPMSDTVHVQVGATEPTNIYINGQLEEFDDLADQTFNGVRVSVAEEGNSVMIAFSNGINLKIETAATVALNFQVVLPASFKGEPVGLLGNYDDDDTNDLQTPTAGVLPDDSTLETIHNDFGLLWVTSAPGSLFTYKSGTNHSTYLDLDFVPVFTLSATEAQTEAAEQVCGLEETECIYDYLTTGREEIALATRQAIQEYETVIQDLKPVLTCGFLATPLHGSQEFNHAREGGVIRFSCDEGYAVQGSIERTCGGDGEWSGTEATCVVSHCTAGVDITMCCDISGCAWIKCDGATDSCQETTADCAANTAATCPVVTTPENENERIVTTQEQDNGGKEANGGNTVGVATSTLMVLLLSVRLVL